MEQVAGGIKINGYDYEQGDKFLAESGRFCYILKAYTQVQPNDIVEAVVENANGSAFKASVRVVCLLDWEYLGVDIGGMTRALAIARLWAAQKLPQHPLAFPDEAPRYQALRRKNEQRLSRYGLSCHFETASVSI